MENKTNSELISILEYSTDAIEKQQAWEQLLKQNPDNEDLRYIIEYTDLKQQAADELRRQFGITGPVDEQALMKEIADNVLAHPGSLKMDSWHCGTSHCIGGWACVLNESAKKIEAESDTETAAFAILPSFSHLFYKDNSTALNELEKIANPTV